MHFFSKPLFIIPLVIFFIGISFIPMADSLLRAERYGEIILSEEEKEEKFQRCLSKIPTSATDAEGKVAEDVCEHILTKYFAGSRAVNTLIDDHFTFIKTCVEHHDIFEFVGEEVALNTYTNPKVRLCIKLFNDQIWKYDREDRLEILAKWYNRNALTARDIQEERTREFLFGSISTSKEDFEEVKTIQMYPKPASTEEKIEKLETKPDANAQEDDRFDFKSEKQVELTKEKFCFLFWCW